MAKKKETVHWTYKGKEVKTLQDMPEGTLGIIYRIENLDTKRYYIGRRTVCSKRKRKMTIAEKKIPGNERKSVVYEMKESSGWKTYCGSNTTLKEEIKNGARIKKTILHYCFSKAEITFLESSEILCSGALEDERSYNDWMRCTIYKKHLLK